MIRTAAAIFASTIFMMLPASTMEAEVPTIPPSSHTMNMGTIGNSMIKPASVGKVDYNFCHFRPEGEEKMVKNDFGLIGSKSKPISFPCRPANFGDVSTEETGTGVGPFKNLMSSNSYGLVLAEPLDACVEPKKENSNYARKVVLAQRGGCSFYKKALNIMKASQGTVAAIIIADNAPNEKGLITLVRGQPKRDKIEAYFSVPVVSALYEDGLLLMETLKAKPNMTMGMSFAKGWENIEREAMIMKNKDESDPAWWHNYAVSLANQNRRTEAIEALNRTICKVSYESVSMMAKLLEDDGSYDHCYEAWKLAAKVATDGSTRMKAMKKAQEVYKMTYQGSEEQQMELKQKMNHDSDEAQALIKEEKRRPFVDVCASGECKCTATPITWQGGLMEWVEASIGAAPKDRRDVCCISTKGAFTITVTPALSPNGAERFLDLVRAGHFTEAPMQGSSSLESEGGVKRRLDASHVRFGDPAEMGQLRLPNGKMRWRAIKDDPMNPVYRYTPLEKGTIAFRNRKNEKDFRDFNFMIATELKEEWPYSQLISDTLDLPRSYGNDMDSAPGATPFGRITQGLDILDNVFNPRGAIDTKSHRIDGNAYLKRFFPKMDFIRSCSIVGEQS
jgi:cyclophilin family peptidyl-prolyl cis-trans isomerase